MTLDSEPDEAEPAASFDLTQLAGRLAQDRYRPVVKLIELVAAHAAVQMDLQRAGLCLSQIRQVEMAGHLHRFSEEMGLLTESLFMNAIFHYTRAVHSTPTSRRRVNVENRFTTEQKALHRSITKLRDQCLAHYGRGAVSADDFWVDDRVIYVPGDPEPVQYPFLRIHHNSLIDAGLMDLIETAGPVVVEARAKLAEQLTEALERLAAEDLYFAGVLAECSFDTQAFHGRA
ncbi:hypothetical protein [Caulobacter sp. RHG1]|uniref:hypothetical protein n=1 Tax=Caulobacter sp. (strain RHG1) TaxID=2545762 RepID=UPI001557009A|nr:hypothetical protein [Caulobacter sp. RHG1]NQE61519.1 hypothetical protein [Caulobacter sp. RHG1]